MQNLSSNDEVKSKASHSEPDPDLNKEIQEFGKEIFDKISKESASAFNKNFWTGKIMDWSMKQPELKLNMFRLVDVLPALKSSEAIIRHVNEYLGKVGAEISSLVKWGLNMNPRSLRAKITASVVRQSVKQMAAQFIAGETPEEALKALKRLRKNKICFTVDLLGEFALSESESDEYLQRYLDALNVFGEELVKWPESAPIIEGHPGETSPNCVSVKLSALYSQCGILNREKSVSVLSEKLASISRRAKELNALIYVDAEDVENNFLIYDTFKRVFSDPEFKDFYLPGIVLQAYARDSEDLLLDLIEFAKERGGPVAVRLVKGAYWDYETIVADQNHWESPLFVRKESSDANYEKLSKILIDNHQYTYPAFGSHNIRSLAHACCYAEAQGLDKNQFELQMLFGMADPISNAFVSQGYLVRQYVPLGEMIPGMGYLIRRLLENTSNESFLRHTFYDQNDVEKLLRQPNFID